MAAVSEVSTAKKIKFSEEEEEDGYRSEPGWSPYPRQS
jgi:hypothetical protein